MLESGNIAWGITATALVMFMTPGPAFFSGGLVKAKSVISMMMMMMMMMSFGALGLISVLWILDGYNMSVIANPTDFAGLPFSDFGLAALASNPEANTDLISVSSGATFAIITTALISGAIADRAKFGAWMLFAGLWATLVYFPVAGWLWGGGWIANLGSWLNMPRVIDWAGGTAVEINSGAAALALGWVIEKTIGFRITNEDEIAGVDSIAHGEEGYAIESAQSSLNEPLHPSGWCGSSVLAKPNRNIPVESVTGAKHKPPPSETSGAHSGSTHPSEPPAFNS